METSITVRNAKLSDAPRILDIYTYYVENTVITFEYDVPSLEESSSNVTAGSKATPTPMLSSAAPPTTGPVNSRSIWITTRRNAGLAENSMKLWLSGSKTWEF